MPLKEPSFTIGIEEEYLVVDRATRDLVVDPPAELLAEIESALANGAGKVSPEFLRSQIEIGTRVCATMKDAREALATLRATIAEITAAYNMAILAVSTHPFASWTEQSHTDRDRYNVLAEDFQVVARRLLICGMHVHIGIDDDDLRIDLMNQATYFLPHLLALSTSSPFWQGFNTGLKSYRLSVFDELPRTGLPSNFDSFSEYERTVRVLIEAGLIEDATKVWWDLRPSARFPTLEMRVTDVCTLIEDAMCVASLFLCICRMLYRLRRANQRWRAYQPFLLRENRWRAQRYGVDQGMLDFGRGEIVPFNVLMDELLALVAEDAMYFDVVPEVERVRTILSRGTSADRQLAGFRAGLEAGLSPAEAHARIIDTLIAETVHGTPAERLAPQPVPAAGEAG